MKIDDIVRILNLIFKIKKLIQAKELLDNLELDSIDSSYSIIKHYYNSTSPGNRNSSIVALFDFIRKIYVFSPSPNELGIDNSKHSKRENNKSYS